MKALRRNFGQGPKVSLFTLGTMRAVGSREQMYEVSKAAFNAGINHLETAPSYGVAEKLIGEALSELRKEKLEPKGGWVLTTKLLPGITVEEGKKQLENSLRNLALSKVDNLAVHGLNLPEHFEWAVKGEGAKLLTWAKEQNLVGQVGFTSHGSLQVITEAIESKEFQFCSLHLHLLDPERIPIAKIALKNKMGVLAISPADKGGHLHTPSTTLIKDCNPFKPIELAYRFLITQGVSTLTIGASKPKDLEIAKKFSNDNSPLSREEEKVILKLKKARQLRLGEEFCEQCKRCLPCPNDVPIPSLLRLRNLAIGHDLMDFSKERYNLIGEAGHWWESVNASSCEECGECLPRCPYHLPIPHLLKETHNLLFTTSGRRLWG